MALIKNVLGWTTFAICLCVGAESFAQSVGGGSRGNGGFSNRVARNPGCTEGRTSIIDEIDRETGRRVTVRRTCKNGSYYDLSNYIYDPKPIKCKDGETMVWSEYVPSAGTTKDQAKKCIKGKWVNIP